MTHTLLVDKACVGIVVVTLVLWSVCAHVMYPILPWAAMEGGSADDLY